MPAKPPGVYEDGRGRWYSKVTLGPDPLTGKRVQITQRGSRTAAEAGRARRDALARIDTGQVWPSSTLLTVNELLDLRRKPSTTIPHGVARGLVAQLVWASRCLRPARSSAPLDVRRHR